MGGHEMSMHAKEVRLARARADAAREALRVERREHDIAAFVESSRPVLAALRDMMLRHAGDPTFQAALGGPGYPIPDAGSTWHRAGQSGGDITWRSSRPVNDHRQIHERMRILVRVSMTEGGDARVTVGEGIGYSELAEPPECETVLSATVPGFDSSPSGFIDGIEDALVRRAADLLAADALAIDLDDGEGISDMRFSAMVSETVGHQSLLRVPTGPPVAPSSGAMQRAVLLFAGGS